MSIANQTIYITGGSTGIGLNIALLLSKNNNTICLFARSLNNLEDAKKLILIEGNSKCHIYSVDTSNYDLTKAALEQAVSDAGVPTLVINCVGRAYPEHFDTITATQMQDTLAVNFGSMWNVCHIITPYMRDKGGKIVNTSSIGGFIGIFGYADYCASKFAIIGFSEVLEQELYNHNIKVQVLCPPDTDTPGFATENKTKPAETQKISESTKLMSAAQVAISAVKGMEGNNFMIIPGAEGKISYWIKRHFPFIIKRIMFSAIKKVQDR